MHRFCLAALIAAVAAAAAPAAQIRAEATAQASYAKSESFTAIFIRGAQGNTTRFQTGSGYGIGATVAILASAGPRGMARMGAGLTRLTLPFGLEDGQKYTMDRLSLQIEGQYELLNGPTRPYILGGIAGMITLSIDDDDILFGLIDESNRRWSPALTVGGGVQFEWGGVEVGPEIRYVHEITGTHVGGQRYSAGEGRSIQIEDNLMVQTVTAALVVRFGRRP